MAATTEHDWQNLAQTLADGFQSLLREAEQLSSRQRTLDAKLKFAHQEYVKLSAHPALRDGNFTEREAIAREMTKEEGQVNDVSDEGIQVQLPPYLDNIEEVKAGFQAYKTVKTRTSQNAPASRCPVSGSQSRPTDLEHDFTTPGAVSGNLGCPFAKMAMQTNGVPTPPQDKFDGDPIKADFEMRSRSSVEAPPSATGTAGKCPIRYLDQHSPEEVARYFEDHKHEIPRSHEVCVKRYQKNSESIRELDSKYGNLVSMIQGLGVKHQQFLPHGREGENDDPGVKGPDSNNDAVSQWADDVGHRSHGGIAASVRSPSPRGEEEAEGDELRTGHFQRPLREIRVGESPSRPWGISVPFAPERAESPPRAPVKEPDFASSSPPQPVQQQQQQHIDPSPNHHTSNPNAKPPAKCPFDHQQARTQEAPPQPKESHTLPQPQPQPQTTTTPQQQQQQQQRPSSMIFNGPVFFGYSADQAAKMMKDMSLFSNV